MHWKSNGIGGGSSFWTCGSYENAPDETGADSVPTRGLKPVRDATPNRPVIRSTQEE
jgi:hypothetical protein